MTAPSQPETLVETWREMAKMAFERGPIAGDEIGHAARWTAVQMCADELEAALTAGGWQLIESIAAKPGDVIVGGYYYGDRWMWNRFEFDEQGGWFCRDGGKATHAFVLPSAPTETKK